jgi:cobalamin synthase
VAPSSGAAWYFERQYPGWSLVLPLQVALLVFVLFGHAWARYAVAVAVAGLLLVNTSDALAPQFGGFLLGNLRNAAIAALELSTVVLLFLPSANSWFCRRRSAA